MKSMITRWSLCAAALLGAAWPAVSLGRNVAAIEKDIKGVEQQINRYPADVLVSPDYRKWAMENLGSYLRQKVQLYQELAAADQRMRLMGLYESSSTQAVLALLKDADATQALEKQANDSDSAVSECGKLGLLQRDWWETPTAEGQRKVLDELIADAQKTPKDDLVARTMVALADTGAATPLLAREARATAAGLPGAYATQYRSIPNKIGWPLTIAGNTIDGRRFASSAWNGKVIVVDFWATWCGPCKAAMPHMIDLYNRLHGEGLEVIGVSNDQNRQDLISYLQQNRSMAWPQLFGPSNSASHWNAMAEAFHVEAIPTMYVIDRNGILRKISVGQEADKEIKELLAETPDPQLADMKPIKLALVEPAVGAAAPKSTASKSTAARAAAAPAMETPAASAAPSAPVAPAAPVADDPAAKATRALNLARSYIKAERYEIARTKLQAVVQTWPATPAAKEAAAVLKEIDGK